CCSGPRLPPRRNRNATMPLAPNRSSDFLWESLPQPLCDLVRLVAVFCLGPAAQGAEQRNPAGSLLIHHVAVEKFTPVSDHADTTGAACRLDRRRPPSTNFGRADVARAGPEEDRLGSRPLSFRGASQVAG